jgi:hypothetical protein
MRKQFLLMMVLFAAFYESYACEICGCAHSNFQVGLLPNFSKGFMGFRYSHSRFSSQVRDEPSEYSRDTYQTMELWGGYNHKKIQFMSFVPYVLSKKETDDGVTTSNGIGDVMLLINYKMFSVTSMSKNEQTTRRNELFVGGGVKLPTGVNEIDVNSPEFNIGDFNSQSGTGSLDFLLNATHNFLWNNSGLVTNVAYRINGENHQHYRFGNRVYLNTVYYYTFTQSNVKIKPNAGVNYQSNVQDRFQGSEVNFSNGYVVNAAIGLNVLRKKIGFNALTFIPVSQNTYDGQTKLKSRFLVGITFSI